MSVDEEVFVWIREAVAAAHSWDSVRRALGDHDPAGEDLRLRPFIFAFSYSLHEFFTEARDRAGGPFGASVAGAGWRYPPALAELPDEDVEAWREALTSVDHPVAKARLGDLLWERRSSPDRHVACAAAIDGLVVVAADENWSAMDRLRCLSRAFELARETRDAARQAVVVPRLIAFAEQDLRAPDGAPGLSIGALRPLAPMPPDERPAGLDALFQHVSEKYGADPFILDSIADLRSSMLDVTERRELRREQVQRWREESAKGDGLLRVHHLERALEIAADHGLTEEAGEIRSELGSISPDELGLKEISAELAIPSDEVERFLEGFAAAPSWEEALRMLAVQGPPGGSPQEVAARVDELMADFPVQFLFPKVLVGPDNASAVFRAATPQDHRRLALAEQRAQYARLWGGFCAQALQRIGARPDRPGPEALSEFLANEFIEPTVAERIARAIELFWDEQFDESAHVLIPRLERVIRQMARQLGLPVIREPRPGREFGSVEALGALLRDLEGAFFDAGWHAYLLNLLADPLGLNLRNAIAHGLHRSVGAIDASLLIQASLLLARMSLRPVEVPPEPPEGAGPAG